MRWLTLILLVLGVLSSPARAAALGNLRVTVESDDGVPLEGAACTASGPSGARASVTDADGIATFTGLAPGPYRLEVELGGFAGVTVDDVEVAAMRTATRDVVLRAIAFAEDVTVLSAGAETEQTFLQHIPPGRSYQSAVPRRRTSRGPSPTSTRGSGRSRRRSRA
jgi:hypothetical protein